ncbi:Ohr family peroxiredoxin [Streptomyces sp. NPDC010273]|uniref:Ohr family peroxiredoxin n=1 Tax=Streptomyces sp. NPDC010273 TaxID=3364829 RepID=UPI0036E3F4EA
MPTLYTTEALSAGDGRNGEVRSLDGVLDELLAVPKEMGGPGGDRTNPEQLFAAGYAACFHNGLRVIAGEQGVQLADSTAHSKVSLLTRDAGVFTLAMTLSAHLPGLSGPPPSSWSRPRTSCARTPTPPAAISRWPSTPPFSTGVQAPCSAVDRDTQWLARGDRTRRRDKAAEEVGRSGGGHPGRSASGVNCRSAHYR